VRSIKVKLSRAQAQFNELKATEMVYLGTDLVLKYQTLRSSPFPRDQDV